MKQNTHSNRRKGLRDRRHRRVYSLRPDLTIIPPAYDEYDRGSYPPKTVTYPTTTRLDLTEETKFRVDLNDGEAEG